MYPQSISDAAWTEIQRVEQLVRNRADAYAIPRVSAEFLHTLVLAAACRRGVEVGTSYGYSGLWIGSAMARQGGTLLTIDHDASKVAQARDLFAHAGLDQTIRVLQGEALSVLKRLEGPFDFVFLDADKARTLEYFETLWPQLGHHALVVTDNITTHADELRGFVTHVRRRAGLCSVLVDIGSGLELSVKVEPEHGPSVDGADWVI